MKLSFKYCRKCLVNYYNNHVFISDQYIRFFIPTIDYLMCCYIALVQIDHRTKAELDNAESNHYTLVDLEQIGDILHVEQGSMHNSDRLKIIDHYYRNEVLLSPQMMMEGVA